MHWKNDIIAKEGSLGKFADGYNEFGFVVQQDGIRVREWVPEGKAVRLVGDFSILSKFQPSLFSSNFFLNPF